LKTINAAEFSSPVGSLSVDPERFVADGPVPQAFAGPWDRPFEAPAPDILDTPVYGVFAAAAARAPEAVALIGDAERLTYREVQQRVDALAGTIDRRVPAGAAVAVLFENCPAAMVAILACLRARRPCIVLDATHPLERNTAILRAARPGAVVVADRARPEASCVMSETALIVLGPSSAAPDDAGFAPTGPHDPHAPAFIQYTSGSTGVPKGIVISQAGMLMNVRDNALLMHVTPGDRLLSASSFAMAGGLISGMTAILTGMSQLSVSVTVAGARAMLERIAGESITIIWAVPAVLRVLLTSDEAAEAMRTVRLIRTYGEPLMALELTKWRSALAPGSHFGIIHGQTETPIAQWFVPPDFQGGEGRLPSGCPWPGLEYQLVDTEGRAVERGEPGELVLRSRYVALGEWESGKCVLGPRLEADPTDPLARILRTGDVLRVRPDGLLEFAGRRDRQIKVRGGRVEPAEIEAALRKLPGVSDAAIVAVDRGDNDIRLVAFIAGAADDLDCAARARVALRRNLPGYMLPDRIERLDALPLIPGGKTDLRALESRAKATLAIVADDAADACLDPAAPVAAAWRRTLGAPSLEADQPFDEAGGDSLRLVKFVYHLESGLGRKVPLEIFSMARRPSEMAVALDRYLHEGATRASTAPTVFYLPGRAGDEPLSADFRAACGDSLCFVTVDYPDWSEFVRAGCELEALVARVVAQIQVAAPDGPLRLAGYSLGGILAYLCSLQLVAAGRTIAALTIFDTQLGWNAPENGPLPTANERLSVLLRRLRTDWDYWKIALSGRIAWRLAMPACKPFLRYLVPLRKVPLPADFRFYLHVALGDELRVAALKRWYRGFMAAAKLEFPVTLFRAETHAPEQPMDLGWRDVCADLTVVPVAGTHTTMLDRENRAALCRTFVDVMERATDGTRD